MLKRQAIFHIIHAGPDKPLRLQHPTSRAVAWPKGRFMFPRCGRLRLARPASTAQGRPTRGKKGGGGGERGFRFRFRPLRGGRLCGGGGSTHARRRGGARRHRQPPHRHARAADEANGAKGRAGATRRRVGHHCGGPSRRRTWPIRANGGRVQHLATLDQSWPILAKPGTTKAHPKLTKLG